MLENLQNTSRPRKAPKRRGRGVGSKLRKTSGRGHKGAGSRSGWKSRARYEGGQNPLYRRLPIRGFSRRKVVERLNVINLSQIEELFNEGDLVSIETLCEKGFFRGTRLGVKVLGDGELTKKVRIEASDISASAKEKLQSSGIVYTIV